MLLLPLLLLLWILAAPRVRASRGERRRTIWFFGVNGRKRVRPSRRSSLVVAVIAVKAVAVAVVVVIAVVVLAFSLCSSSPLVRPTCSGLKKLVNYSRPVFSRWCKSNRTTTTNIQIFSTVVKNILVIFSACICFKLHKSNCRASWLTQLLQLQCGSYSCIFEMPTRKL